MSVRLSICLSKGFSGGSHAPPLLVEGCPPALFGKCAALRCRIEVCMHMLQDNS